MADLDKCYGKNCSLKDNCLRYLSKPDQFQYYFTNTPVKENVCVYQIEL